MMLSNLFTLILLVLVNTVSGQNATTTASAPAATYTVSVGAVRIFTTSTFLLLRVLTILCIEWLQFQSTSSER